MAPGTSKERVHVEQQVPDLMRECARLIGRRLRTNLATPG